MHTCYLLTRCSKNQEVLTEFDKFIIVFSGLCHDVGHTGFTNLFEIARQSDIAITYNNRSVILFLRSLYRCIIPVKHSKFLKNPVITSYHRCPKRSSPALGSSPSHRSFILTSKNILISWKNSKIEKKHFRKSRTSLCWQEWLYTPVTLEDQWKTSKFAKNGPY